MFFVRDNVVRNANNPGVFILSYFSQNRSKTGAHKRRPIANDYQIRTFLFKNSPNFEPIERIDRVYNTVDYKVSRCRLVCKLRLAGEKKSRILQRKWKNFCCLPVFLQSLCQTFVKSRYASPAQRIGTTKNYHISTHRRIFYTYNFSNNARISFELRRIFKVRSACPFA